MSAREIITMEQINPPAIVQQVGARREELLKRYNQIEQHRSKVDNESRFAQAEILREFQENWKNFKKETETTFDKEVKRLFGLAPPTVSQTIKALEVKKKVSAPKLSHLLPHLSLDKAKEMIPLLKSDRVEAFLSEYDISSVVSKDVRSNVSRFLQRGKPARLTQTTKQQQTQPVDADPEAVTEESQTVVTVDVTVDEEEQQVIDSLNAMADRVGEAYKLEEENREALIASNPKLRVARILVSLGRKTLARTLQAEKSIEEVEAELSIVNEAVQWLNEVINNEV